VALDEAFAEAWLNNSHKILGFRLKPFSLWHRFLLSITGSRVMESDDINIYDIIGFCRICTNQYPRVRYKVRKLDQFLLLFHRQKSQVPAELEAYIKDYCAFPEFWEKKQEGKSGGGAPEPLGSVVALMQMGFSNNEAWDMPVGMAQYYTATYMQQQGGDIDFITPEEKEMFAAMKNEKSDNNDDDVIDWAAELKASPENDNKVDWDEVLAQPKAKPKPKLSKDEQDFLAKKFGGKTELTKEEHDNFVASLKTEPAARFKQDG
jgi:hypothetical protein